MPAAPPADSWWGYLQAAAHEVYEYSASQVGLDPRGPPGTLKATCSTCGTEHWATIDSSGG